MKALPPFIRRSVFLIPLLVIGLTSTQAQEIAKKKFLQHGQVVGSKECIECHESEIKAWQETQHFHNRDLHTDERAAEIAKNMGISSPTKIRTSGLCIQCHFTVQRLGSNPARVIDGVSCESCHGGAKDWLKTHNSGDRREPDDSASARESRVAQATEAGMIYPEQIHEVAANCFSCHIVTDEKLVNVGGHPAGSEDFELVSWIKGEVQHNFFDNKAVNADTPIERQRLLYIVGKALEMEYSLRGLGRAKEKADYGNSMGRRSGATRNDIVAIVEALGDSAPEELTAIVEVISVPGLLKYFNVDPLNAAADSVAEQIALLVENHDGSAFGAIDALIPEEGQGTTYHP